MLTVFNPTDAPITKTIRANLYYTGLKDKAAVSEQDHSSQITHLSRDYFVDVAVTVAANAMNWFVIR